MLILLYKVYASQAVRRVLMPAGTDLMLHILCNRQQNFTALVSKLLDIIVQQLPVSSTVLYQPPPKSEDGAASMLGTVNRMMMLPARAVSSLWRQESWGGARSPAADASLCLLLLLLHQEHPKSHLEEPGFHTAFQVPSFSEHSLQYSAYSSGVNLSACTQVVSIWIRLHASQRSSF